MLPAKTARSKVCEPAAETNTAMNASQISNSQNRSVKAEPAPIRFFHNNATAGSPVGPSRNGGRFFFVGRPANRPRLARMVTMRSAIFCDASTDASSNATFDRTTHQ